MKDRLVRTNVKKSNHHLKRFSIIGGILALISTTAITVCLVTVSNNNAQLTNNINDYNNKVDNYNDVQDEEITKIQLTRK